MKSDITQDREWLKDTQDRFAAWELFQRALADQADIAPTDQEWKRIADRCGISESDQRAMIYHARKRIRNGEGPADMRLMSNTDDHA